VLEVIVRLLFCAFLALFSFRAATAQHPHRVDGAVRYHRLIAVVPLVGTGTHADPIRPQYAPTAMGRANRTGIIAYSHVLSDDKKLALVEFVSLRPIAFAPILADKNPKIKTFNRGQAKKDDIDKELKKYKKDFDLNKFGVMMP
jgi:hypothetical protein